MNAPRRDAASREREASRRRFVAVAGGAGLVAGTLGLLGALARSVVPDVLYEPPRRFRAASSAVGRGDAVDWILSIGETRVW